MSVLNLPDVGRSSGIKRDCQRTLGAALHMVNERELLTGAYRDFNARHLDAVLDRLSPSVKWANGLEGAHIHGRDAVREYWTKQWAVLDPHVEPKRIELDKSNRWVVTVHQVVKDLKGNQILDTIVYHVCCISDGLIERMDIAHEDPLHGGNA